MSGALYKVKNMSNTIKEIYDIGMEKYAGDAAKAKEFAVGFLKKASLFDNRFIQEGAGKALGTGIAALGVGLGVHGISSFMNASANANLHNAFQRALASVRASNPLLEDADPSKVNSYAETIFKFAPHVACDHNLLSTVLAHIVQGEGVDTTIMKTLVELEKQIIESRKAGLFTPKNYT